MSEPVADLRGKQWGLKAVVAIAIVVAIVIGIAVIKFALHDSDPGADACAHVGDLVARDPRAADAWDARVRAAARALEGRVVQMTVSGDTKVEIQRDTADATCRELLRVYYNTSMYKHFERLTGCVSKAASVSAVSQCFDDMGL